MISSKQFVRQSLVAAAYVAVSLAIAPLSFGIVQVRFSEILMLLVFIDRRYSMALIVGCLLTNFFSPMGMVDAVFGTLATALCCFAMTKTKQVYFSLFLLPVINGVIIGLELAYVWQFPLLLSVLSVAAGEFIAVLIGILFYKKFEKHLRQIIGAEQK